MWQLSDKCSCLAGREAASVWQPITKGRETVVPSLQRIEKRGVAKIGQKTSQGIVQNRRTPWFTWICAKKNTASHPHTYCRYSPSPNWRVRGASLLLPCKTTISDVVTIMCTDQLLCFDYQHLCIQTSFVTWPSHSQGGWCLTPQVWLILHILEQHLTAAC